LAVGQTEPTSVQNGPLRFKKIYIPHTKKNINFGSSRLQRANRKIGETYSISPRTVSERPFCAHLVI
jgi:hypothetical protein